MAKTAEIPAVMLVAAGEILHGADWQAALARSLNLGSPRLMERWAAAARQGQAVRVSRSLAAELADLVEGRINDVAGALRRASAQD